MQQGRTILRRHPPDPRPGATGTEPDPDAPPPPAAELRWARGPFAALGHRNFRLFYSGQVLSLTGTWMHRTAEGWLVLELTDSEFLLGAVNAAGTLPVLLLTLYAGVIADQRDKRSIILAAQTASLVVAAVLAVLVDAERATVPAIMALALALGVANAFEIPTRQSWFVELVGRRDLTNAIALNSSAFNLTRIVGPALAGILIGAVGIAACFYLNAVSYLAVIAGLLAIRRAPFRAPPRPASNLESLREGFRFVWRDRLARTLVALVALTSILALPYSVLLPVFARDVLGAGAAGLGALLSATGAGALAGGLALATAGGRLRRGRLMLVSAVAFSLLLIAFSLSRSLPLSLALLAAAGFSLVPFTATVNATLQTAVPDELRGRVMGVYVFMFLGMAPFGALQAGAVAGWVGAPAALALGAGLLMLAVVAAWLRVEELREVR